jgi:hemerythrin superfamily protein
MNTWSDQNIPGSTPVTGDRPHIDRPVEGPEPMRYASTSGRSYAPRSRSLSPSITTMIQLDHTHVLALFRRFKPSTSAARKHALAENACLALEVHAKLEEEIFYPALREVAGGNPVLEKSVPEHNEMRSLIEAVRQTSVTSGRYDEALRALMRAVLHHVADEESTLLPLAEACMADRLRDLGREMTTRRMELLRPHLGEVARTSALSFPLASSALAAGFIALGWWAARRVVAGNRDGGTRWDRQARGVTRA